MILNESMSVPPLNGRACQVSLELGMVSLRLLVLQSLINLRPNFQNPSPFCLFFFNFVLVITSKICI